jgi:uncharacterized membrane protein YfcA
MDIISILIASFISLIISIFSVSVGGTSLITVPVLISLGMSAKTAVATNMFALIFLSLCGAAGLKKASRITQFKLFAFLSVLTVGGSFLGANMVLTIDQDVLRKIISVMISIMALSFLIKKNLGLQEAMGQISNKRLVAGSLLIFILGIYGGFFSGGYVTLLSFVLLLIFNLNFLQVAFAAKVFNIFSSAAAFILFYFHGLVDFSVGIPLACSMSLGAIIGAKLAIKKGNIWIRNLFLFAVALLALKLLFL